MRILKKLLKKKPDRLFTRDYVHASSFRGFKRFWLTTYAYYNIQENLEKMAKKNPTLELKGETINVSEVAIEDSDRTCLLFTLKGHAIGVSYNDDTNALFKSNRVEDIYIKYDRDWSNVIQAHLFLKLTDGDIKA